MAAHTGTRAEGATGVDRWLLLMVAAILLLVLVTLVVVLTRPEPAYLVADTPEAVVQNYLLALRKGDVERAYGYLAPDLDGYPTLAEFERRSRNWPATTARSFTVLDSKSFPEGLTCVTVRATEFTSNGPFDSYSSSRDFTLELRSYPDGWRLVGGEGSWYWYWCWEGSCN